MKFRQSLFWDTNPNKLDIHKNATYIVERIMDFGLDEDVRWMRKTYPTEFLREVLKKSKVLHPSSRKLWQILTNQQVV